MDRNRTERSTGIIKNPLDTYKILWTTTATMSVVDIEENSDSLQNTKETRQLLLDSIATYDRVQQNHDCYDSDSSCKQQRSVSSGEGSDMPLLNSAEQVGILTLKDCDHCHKEQELNTNSVAKLQLSIACLLCLVFMIAEIVGGYIAGSTAVMTDAAHMLSDFVGLFVSLCAMWISGHKPTRRLTFGYYRVEVLGALLSVSVIWVLTAVFVFVAVQRIVSGVYEIHSSAMMLVSIFGIFVNIVMAIILASDSCLRGHHSSHGYRHHHCNPHYGDEMNINLRAAVIHVLGDLLQSIGVFIAACVVTFFPEAKLADPICTFVFAPIVIATTLRVVRDTTWVLLEACPMHLDYSTIARDLCMLDGVEAIHDLNIWALTPGQYVLTVHLTVDASTDHDTILERSQRLLRAKYNLYHLTIQVEKFLPDIMDKCPQCQLPDE